jgi:hypothetical protein
MLIRNELPQRAHNKQLQLIPPLCPSIPRPRRIINYNGIRRRGLFQRPLGAQDRQCAEQAAEEPATESQAPTDPAQGPGTVVSAAFRRCAFNLLKACSIGLRSGEYGVKQRRARSFDRLPHAGTLANGQVVHDDVAPLECRNQTLLEIGKEHRRVHCAIDHERRDDRAIPQAGHEGDRFPMPMRSTADQSYATWTTVSEPHHVGGRSAPRGAAVGFLVASTPQKNMAMGCCGLESGDAVKRSRLGN